MYETIFKSAERFKAQPLGRDQKIGGMKQRENVLFMKVEQDQAVPFITWLKELGGFGHLVLFTAVDFIEQELFQLTYLLHSYEQHHDIVVLVEIDRRKAEMESIHHLWPHAATYQQELFEMFGITFPGSPRLYEDFALEGWQGPPPMRRDFDTKEYSEKTYFPRPGRVTHDPATYMKEQLYPGEAQTW